MTGMAEALAARGWDLSVRPHLEEELATYRNISRTRHVSGLIIPEPLPRMSAFSC